MKIRLENPAVNVSKLTGGKNEKDSQPARWGALYMKNFGQIYILFNETIVCDMLTCGSIVIEILFTQI